MLTSIMLCMIAIGTVRATCIYHRLDGSAYIPSIDKFQVKNCTSTNFCCNIHSCDVQSKCLALRQQQPTYACIPNNHTYDIELTPFGAQYTIATIYLYTQQQGVYNVVLNPLPLGVHFNGTITVFDQHVRELTSEFQSTTFASSGQIVLSYKKQFDKKCRTVVLTVVANVFGQSIYILTGMRAALLYNFSG